MKLVLSFSTLLASLVIAIALVGDAVEARPHKREGGITLPLKRLNAERSNVHPQILLQQRVNRAEKRLAKMTGREAPSDLELRKRLNKRAFFLPLPAHQSEKRYNRQGVVPIGQISAANTNDDAKKTTTANGKGATANKHAGGNGGAGAAGAGAAGAGAGAAGASVGTATADAADATGTGISEKDIEAAANGGLTQADQPSDSDSLGLDIEANDEGYIATVQIGTPPTDYLILMDSGSADFWVGSENCQSEGGGGCGNHTFLGSQSSSTFVDNNQPFNVTYGSGEVSGDIVTDNVAIAGLQLNTHTFGVANTESVQFSSDATPFDGLMGLAQSTLSEQGVDTPVESLSKAGLIPATITSFKLGRVADADNDGEVTFGSLDTSKFDQNSLVTFDNVNQEGFWEGAMDAVTVGGQDLGLKGRTAILDTGTTLIIAPDADAQAVHAAIPGAQSDGQGGFTIPCTTSTPVALSFGGTSFAIDPRDLLFSPVDPNDPTGDCVSGISSGQIGAATEWLVGDVFLKNVYFSTNEDKNAISLATLT